MKTTFTNQEKQTFFNFKISCLMKKQFSYLVMMLAMMILAGTSAMAQGLYPTDTYEIAVGSSATFAVDDNSTNSTYVWDVCELAATSAVGTTFSTSVNDATSGKVIIDTPTAYSTSIKFFDAQETDNIFVVECTETETGGCSTVRRFYVTVFNFEVEVLSLGEDSTEPTDWATTDAAESLCNSWSGSVVKNTMDAAFVATMRQDSVNNATDLTGKYTYTYFAVRMTLTGASLQNYKWRFQYSMPAASALYMYEIAAVTTGPTFISQSGDANWVATTTTNLTAPTAYVSATADNYSTTQTIYVPHNSADVATAIYVFRVSTHNLLGAADMIYDVKIDRVQLEKDSDVATVDYNNGEKYNTDTESSTTGLARLDGVNDITAKTTIDQSPATEIITITD
jgi:hypothetical protein